MERRDERLERLEAALGELQGRTARLERQLRLWRGAAGLLAVAGLLFLPLTAGMAQRGRRPGLFPGPPPPPVPTLEERVAELEQKLARVSVENGGRDLVLTGANLHVRSGHGRTPVGPLDPTYGLGNLIVGYNERRPDTPRNKPMGSHNLVIGPFHNFPSYGGLVVGFRNEISAEYCVVTGGRNNIASGGESTVSGGMANVAAGLETVVSGGGFNTASGTQAAVSGGAFNTAAGTQSSVSGGSRNSTGQALASVSGGEMNVAKGPITSVTGGSGNVADGVRATVSGGQGRTVTGEYDWRAGDLFQDR